MQPHVLAIDPRKMTPRQMGRLRDLLGEPLDLNGLPPTPAELLHRYLPEASEQADAAAFLDNQPILLPDGEIISHGAIYWRLGINPETPPGDPARGERLVSERLGWRIPGPTEAMPSDIDLDRLTPTDLPALFLGDGAAPEARPLVGLCLLLAESCIVYQTPGGHLPIQSPLGDFLRRILHRVPAVPATSADGHEALFFLRQEVGFLPLEWRVLDEDGTVLFPHSKQV